MGAAIGEIVVRDLNDKTDAKQLERMVAAGRARKIYERVYTTNMHDDLREVVKRNLWAVVAAVAPGTVVSARSAAAGGPTKGPDGKRYVFLTGDMSRRNIDLPGLEIRVVSGPGPLPGDMPFMGLHVASQGRLLLENLRTSRNRDGIGVVRTLGRAEVETYLMRQLDAAGEERLNHMLDQAREIAREMGHAEELETLDGLIGGLLGSRPQRFVNPAAMARASGSPYDEACVDRLHSLAAHLRSNPVLVRRESTDRNVQMATDFIEAYFSNYIEGTKFSVAEAKEIVLEGRIPAGRPKDGHDVLATYRLLSTRPDLMRRAKDFDEFERMLRARHGLLMAAHTEMRPGTYKQSSNRAGNTTFVAPDKVRGTLRYGFDLLQAIEDPFARGLFVHCMLAEIHPFPDGNGRIARIHMAGELSSAGLSRAIIPSVFRDDYLGAMRSMSRRGDPSAVVRCFDRAQRTTSEVEAPSPDEAVNEWAKTNAFIEGGANARFEEYDRSRAVEWRNGVPASADYWLAEDHSEPSPFVLSR